MQPRLCSVEQKRRRSKSATLLGDRMELSSLAEGRVTPEGGIADRGVAKNLHFRIGRANGGTSARMPRKPRKASSSFIQFLAPLARCVTRTSRGLSQAAYRSSSEGTA